MGSVSRPLGTCVALTALVSGWPVFPPNSTVETRRESGADARYPLKPRRFANVNGLRPSASGSEQSWFAPRRGLVVFGAVSQYFHNTAVGMTRASLQLS